MKIGDAIKVKRKYTHGKNKAKFDGQEKKNLINAYEALLTTLK
jgi:hypothetical protein